MKPSSEQIDIIMNTNGSVVVSAGAGAGKTRTLVEKIRWDISQNEHLTHKIIAAITFTIKATNEIKTRLSVSNNDDVYVSTNNQFVINEIIKPFCKDVYGEDFNKDFDVNYRQRYDDFDLCLEALKDTGKICSMADDKQNFVFQLALKILKNSAIARTYLSSKYYKWYIDEYQDSDNDMHAFFMYAHSTLKIDLFVVGDEKQNIYAWRGANSQNFKDLFKNKDFTSKRLTANFRSRQQIQNISNLLNAETQSLIKAVEDGARDVFIYPINENTNMIDKIFKGVNKYKMHTAVLCRINRDAENVCKALNKKGLNFIYVPITPIDDITSANSWMYFGVAHYCLVNRNVYDFLEYVPVEAGDKSDPLTNQINTLLREIFNFKSNKSEFIQSFKKLAALMECEVEDENIERVLSTVLNESNALAFYNNDNNNQVLTIHKSKGKEFDLIFLFSSDFSNITNGDGLNNLYVAMTRAKSQLIVFNTANSSLMQFVNNQISSVGGECKNFYSTVSTDEAT